MMYDVINIRNIKNLKEFDFALLLRARKFNRNYSLFNEHVNYFKLNETNERCEAN